MNFLKSIVFFSACTIFISNGCMEPEKPAQTTTTFEDLPRDLHNLIISSLIVNENSLNAIISKISKTAQVNKYFNSFINNPSFIDILIQKLQEKSQISKLTYALVLSQFPGTLAWLKEQLKKGTIKKSNLENALISLAVPENLEQLIEKNTNFTFTETPILTVNAIKTLINVGANPNSQNEQGYTPLMVAGLKNNKSILIFLLNLSNIDLSIKNQQDNTALEIARIHQNKEIEKILQDYLKQKKLNK
ncbi:MAG: ankyrin repeat domain-containing protein [Candidatus Babeliales bacterium]